MARYTKKIHIDETEVLSSQRFQRRTRSQKSLAAALEKHDRRHGWGYAKRRAILNEE